MSPGHRSHDYWRQLTALAPTGELNDDEIFELAAHLDQCEECRALLTEYERVSSILPLLEFEDSAQVDEAAGGNLLAQREGRKRLTARLHESGAIREEPRLRAMPVPLQPVARSKVVAWSTAAIACVLLATIGIGVWNVRRANDRAQQADVRALAARDQTDRIAQRVQTLETTQQQLLAQLDSKSRDAFLASQKRDQTDSALNELNSARQADLSSLTDLREKMKALASELEAARTESKNLLIAKQDAETKLQDASRTSTTQLAEQQKQLSDQLRKTATLEGRIQDLTRKSQEQEVAILRQERLLATDRDIRDLMGARNLHIIDASDNTAGRQEPWFGRVFYTEGKSLVFYAFDLDQQKNLRRASTFQVWGEKQGVKAKARSLGVFYLDQKTQDRWILKFEDPDVLAQIDRVYVTVEPPGGSASPHGKELLATNLAIPANHP